MKHEERARGGTPVALPQSTWRTPRLVRSCPLALSLLSTFRRSAEARARRASSLLLHVAQSLHEYPHKYPPALRGWRTIAQWGTGGFAFLRGKAEKILWIFCAARNAGVARRGARSGLEEDDEVRCDVPARGGLGIGGEGGESGGGGVVCGSGGGHFREAVLDLSDVLGAV